MDTKPNLAAGIVPPRSRSQVALDIAEQHPDAGTSGRGRMSPSTAIGQGLGVSRGAIARARIVLASGNAELIDDVRLGRLSVHAAWKRLRSYTA